MAKLDKAPGYELGNLQVRLLPRLLKSGQSGGMVYATVREAVAARLEGSSPSSDISGVNMI